MVLAFVVVVVLAFLVAVMLIVVVTFMATLTEHVKFNAGRQGDAVVAFALNVNVNEAKTLFVVVFIVHHLEHHLNF